MTPDEIVTAFMQAVERKDYDTALGFLADDVEYLNVPMPPAAIGPQAVRNVLEPFLAPMDEVEWVVHRQVANDHLVANERTDRFRAGDTWIEAPVAGIWEVRDGKITVWRDYFDLQGLLPKE